MKNLVFFDLETKKSFRDVAGKGPSAMGISVAVTYSTARGSYMLYQESESDELAEELMRADLVVGWNHILFDYPVLQGQVLAHLQEQTVNLDMMNDLQQREGFRLKLDSVASASLGLGKTADGLDALRWWQEYQRTRDISVYKKIAEYCAYDVKVTKNVFEFGAQHGYVQYRDKNNPDEMKRVEVDWAKYW